MIRSLVLVATMVVATSSFAAPTAGVPFLCTFSTKDKVGGSFFGKNARIVQALEYAGEDLNASEVPMVVSANGQTQSMTLSTVDSAADDGEEIVVTMPARLEKGANPAVLQITNYGQMGAGRPWKAKGFCNL